MQMQILKCKYDNASDLKMTRDGTLENRVLSVYLNEKENGFFG